MTLDRLQVARHEAAHAVHAILHGRPVHRVVVFDKAADRLTGYVQPTPAADPPEEVFEGLEPIDVGPELNELVDKMIEQAAMNAYVGVAAQYPSMGGRWLDGELCFSSGDDRAHVVLYASFYRRVFPELCLETLERAREWADAHWGQIEAVARALLERDELSGDEVRALIEAAQPERNWMRPPPDREVYVIDDVI